MNQILKLLCLKNYDTIIAAIAGFIIIYAFTRHSGVGVSPDSVVYLSTARYFHENRLFNDFDNKPLVIFPLLYSIFLSIVMFVTNHEPLALAPILNPILFALV